MVGGNCSGVPRIFFFVPPNIVRVPTEFVSDPDPGGPGTREVVRLVLPLDGRGAGLLRQRVDHGPHPGHHLPTQPSSLYGVSDMRVVRFLHLQQWK